MTSLTILRNLEKTFGKIPKTIEDNVKYLSYNVDHDNFTCRPCGKTIKTVNDNEDLTTKNFMKHLLSSAHKDNTIEDAELWRNLLHTFDRKVPQIVENNRSVLGMYDSDYECTLCEKYLQVSNSKSVTEKNFSYHLLSAGHEEKLEQYFETLSQLHNVYGGIPIVVLNHKQFLKSDGQHYLCVICDKNIQVHSFDIKKTEINFEKHLHSLKHVRKAKEAKAFSLFPELQPMFSPLPNYMRRNIDYISINGTNFFCSLCNKNIKYNRYDLVETKQNFKLHFLSLTHDVKLQYRRNPDNQAFAKLHILFETFPDIVLCQLKHLTINKDDYFCNVCKVTIVDHEDNTEVEENLTSHFESQNHTENVSIEFDRQNKLIEDLGNEFGSVPDTLIDNIEHIQFKGGNNFKCVLCNQSMKSKDNGNNYDQITTVTLSNFESHLNSNQHNQELERLEHLDEDLQADLEELCFPIPQFIMNNIDHIDYEQDGDNFFCHLCCEIIVVDYGNKKGEITERNFRSHLLSVGHMAKLKHQANEEMEATEKLELIFNKVPPFILCNVEHLERRGGNYYCTLCDFKIMLGGSTSTELKFREHLNGAQHMYNVKAIDEDMDEALRLLDSRFWRVPEFILRNVDFLCTSFNDLFCLLCQETLPLDEDNLEDTWRTLRCHMDSDLHQHNLSSM